MDSENSNSHDAPVPFEIVLETNPKLTQNPPQEYDSFIASLPSKSFNNGVIRLYQGFWIREIFLRGALAMQEHFNPLPNDLFIASYPKSGTTWLKALIFATMTRTKYPLDQNPLLIYNPHQCVPIIEKEYTLGRRMVIEAAPPPRVFSTHIPFSILPNSITNSTCRIVYIWRDPKDVIVSMWHFVLRNETLNLPTSVLLKENLPTFVEWFDLFCEGIDYFFSPIWDHIMGYWQESKRKPEKVLFLKYEYMLTEPVKYAKILANFIGCPYSEAEEKQGVIENIIDLCSFEKLKNLEVNKTGYSSSSGKNLISYASFFRNGIVGDWKNHMTYEMAQKLDKIIADKFKQYGFEMPNMKNEAT